MSVQNPRPVDDTPVNDEIEKGISSNWAFDHAANLAAHTLDQRQFMRIGSEFCQYPATLSTGAGTHPANYVFASHIVISRPITIDRLRIVTCIAATAGDKARLGIYRDDGNCYPGALLLDAGEVSIEIAATKYITLTPSLKLPRGLYWTCYIATADVRPNYRFWNYDWSPMGDLAGVSSMYLCLRKSQAYGSLPNPYPAAADPTWHAAGIWFRVESLD